MAEPCNKTSYPGERRARLEARRLADNTGEPFRAYACPDCGRWHLSTNRPPPPPPRRRGSRQKRSPRARNLEEMETIAARMRADRAGEVSDA